jgi:hypothetical protein
VLIDDEAKGNLASGALTLSGVPDGRHTLAIEAKDYQRYETTITVHTGETLPHNATLVEMSKLAATPSGPPITVEGTVAAKSEFNVWKPVFYGTTAVAVAAGVFAVVEWKKANDDAPNGTSNHDCKSSSMGPLKTACDVSSVVGAAAIGSFYLAFIRDRDSDHTETQTARRGHKKRRELAVTPIVTPDGGGATLRIDW